MRKLGWLLFVLSSAAWAQYPTLVQSSGNKSSTGATCAFAGSVVSGNILVMASSWESAVGTPTLSDTRSSTWAQAVLATGGTVKTAVYIATAAGSGAETITLTETGGTFQKTACAEFSGVTATVDTTDSKTFSSTTSIASNSITATQTADLIIAYSGTNSGTVFQNAGSGYTLIGSHRGGDSAALEYKVAGANGSYSATFTATANTTGTIATVALTPNALNVATASLPDAAVQQAYSYQLIGAGGTGAYTWSINTGTLQSGFSLNSSTGVISGTPVEGGTRTFTFTVTDGASSTANSGSLTLRVGAGLNSISVSTISNCGSFTPSTGDLIAVDVSFGDTAVLVTKVTDTIGTVYTPAVLGNFSTDPQALHIYTGIAPSSAANAISVNGSGSIKKCIRAANVQNFIDVTVVTTGSGATGTTTITSNSLTPLVPNELLLASADGFTAGTTLDANSPFTTWGNTATHPMEGYQVVSTVTGYTAAFASSGNTDGRYLIDLLAMRPTVNNNFVQTQAPRKLIGPF